MQSTKQDKAATEAVPHDAIELLEADHRAVEKLFTAFKKTADDDLDAKATLAQRACEELSIHNARRGTALSRRAGRAARQ